METRHTPGPWLWSHEGVWILKRELRDADGNHAGYELLDGDYRALAEAHEAAVAIVAEAEGRQP
jgi:hypothetical protein